MRKLVIAGLVVSIAGALAASSGVQAASLGRAGSRSAVVQVSTRKIPKLGTVLVNAKGRTLYMFVPDKRSKVTCVGACAAIWPPLKLPAGAKAVAFGAAKTSLLASDADPAGGRVVTYNHWPLYTYVGDRAAGQAKGQALKLNGGYWYVLSPTGTVIRTKLTGGSKYP
jgi:predicted lipoprotein with Yx(FWY)xxD motif